MQRGARRIKTALPGELKKNGFFPAKKSAQESGQIWRFKFVAQKNRYGP
jgi:hypothetical protein